MSFRYLRENKFKRFEAVIDPFIRGCVDIELTAHYFLHYHNYRYYYETIIQTVVLSLWRMPRMIKFGVLSK